VSRRTSGNRISLARYVALAAAVVSRAADRGDAAGTGQTVRFSSHVQRLRAARWPSWNATPHRLGTACLENVVFRDGVAVALIDFDYAAPGRPVHDLAQFAKMCVPLEDDVNAARLG
jgi:aminoglycoside phosphotransferase (APT) family kinase protein